VKSQCRPCQIKSDIHLKNHRGSDSHRLRFAPQRARPAFGNRQSKHPLHMSSVPALMHDGKDATHASTIAVIGTAEM
jgi:hypothetical protein